MEEGVQSESEKRTEIERETVIGTVIDETVTEIEMVGVETEIRIRVVKRIGPTTSPIVTRTLGRKAAVGKTKMRKLGVAGNVPLIRSNLAQRLIRPF